MNEEDEASIGIAYRRLKPFMFHALGSDFLKAAGDFQMRGDSSPAHNFLCCKSIELSLKAFLLTKGVSMSKLKSRKWVGHDLERALEEAELKGLLDVVEITCQWKEELTKANYYYKSKQGFEYADEEEVLMFGKELPSGKVLYELASTLVEKLRGVCSECIYSLLAEKSKMEKGVFIIRIGDEGCRALEVSLRALWCKARGGGGRLRHAT
jgi:hypothetical protein